MTALVADRQEVVNFGCRLNLAEGEMVRTAVKAAGERDMIVFNSCAVTDEAVRQARQATEDGASPVIVIGVSGSGQLDLPAYAEFLSGDMADS